MPPVAMPFVIAIVAVFAAFMLVLGTVSIWAEAASAGRAAGDDEPR